jgi:uncharacterized protein YegJ (DUF2314 family)
LRRSRLVWVGALGLVSAGVVAPAWWWWRAHRGVPVAIQVSETAFEFAVYFLPKPATDLRRVVDDVATDLPSLVVGDGEPQPAAGKIRVFRTLVEDVAKTYAPPEGESLRLFGRGLSREQASALGLSRQALRLRFRIPPGRALDGLRVACRLAPAVARRTGGLVWDEETREVFTPAEWEARRLDDWLPGTVPDVSRQIVSHSYRNGEYVRAVTLGMSKFGLPDLVVEDFAASNTRSVGHLLNLTAQTLAEGAALREGELTLALDEIKHPRVRAAQKASLKPHAKGQVVLRLREGRAEEGDPANRLLEIVFDNYPGPDSRARQDRLLSDLFGWEDAVAQVQHDDALLAASRRARERLPAMKAIVAGGLAPGQLLTVKAPFRKPDGGNEWMWVEVVSWRERRIRGVLMNEPFEVPGLRAGQDVTVDEGDIFDYLLQSPDGTTEGNETSRIIEARTKKP